MIMNAPANAATQPAAAAPQHAAPVTAPALAAAANQPETPPTTPATPPVASPTPPQAPPAPADEPNPAWLPGRLKQAKETALRELLESHGLKSPDELQTSLDELKKLKESTLSEAEKQAARLKELEPLAEEGKRIKTTFAELVQERFEKLPEAQQKAIDDVASGDPELRWRMLKVAEAGAAAAGPPKPTPASTVHPGAQPAPQPTSPDTAFGIWQRKQAEDPMGASLYYRLNSIAIEKSRPAST